MEMPGNEAAGTSLQAKIPSDCGFSPSGGDTRDGSPLYFLHAKQELCSCGTMVLAQNKNMHLSYIDLDHKYISVTTRLLKLEVAP